MMAACASASASPMLSSPPTGTSSGQQSASRSPSSIDTTLDRFNLVFEGIPESNWSVNATDADAQQVRRVATPEFVFRPRTSQRAIGVEVTHSLGPRWSSAIASLTMSVEGSRNGVGLLNDLRD